MKEEGRGNRRRLPARVRLVSLGAAVVFACGCSTVGNGTLRAPPNDAVKTQSRGGLPSASREEDEAFIRKIKNDPFPSAGFSPGR
jgi:hypothetical protein